MFSKDRAENEKFLYRREKKSFLIDFLYILYDRFEGKLCRWQKYITWNSLNGGNVTLPVTYFLKKAMFEPLWKDFNSFNVLAVSKSWLSRLEWFIKKNDVEKFLITKKHLRKNKELRSETCNSHCTATQLHCRYFSLWCERENGKMQIKTDEQNITFDTREMQIYINAL